MSQISQVGCMSVEVWFVLGARLVPEKEKQHIQWREYGIRSKNNGYISYKSNEQIAALMDSQDINKSKPFSLFSSNWPSSTIAHLEY